MKAAVFYAKHDLRIEEIPTPVPHGNEVLVKVMACGICGTDVHIFHGDEGAAPTPAGTVIGHEFAGIVEAVGENVTRVKVGDRVACDPNEVCGQCEYCQNGMAHYCENMIGYGTVLNGGFAEYCCLPESQCNKILDTTTFEEGAMNEPVACCLHGLDMCDINAGEDVAVIGGGAIGLLMLQLAKIRGAGRLVLIEPVESKRELGKKLGADLCIDPFNEDVKAVLEANGITRLACVIECVGRVSTMSQAIDIAGKKATVMLFGLTAPGDVMEVLPFEIFKKELSIKASFINPYTQKRALSLIDGKKLDVSSMVYALEPLERLPEILADAEFRSNGKVIISPWKK